MYMKWIIYKVTSPSGKIYIGQTSKSLEERWNGHCNQARYGSNLLLHRAIRKYGAQNFKKEIVSICESLEKACTEEMQFIELYDCICDTGKGYNMTKGGEGNPMSDLTKSKLSQANKGQIPWSKGKKLGPFSSEHKRKLSDAHKGKTLSAKHKKQISESVTGENNGFYNRKHNKENRVKCGHNRKVNSYFSVWIADKTNRFNPKPDKFVGEWWFLSECADYLDIDRKGIGECLNGRAKSYKGYIFQYNNSMKWIIYKVISPSGKVYIGQTSKSLEERKTHHEYEARKPKYENNAFKRAIRKYGDLLKWEVLESNIGTLEKSHKQEIYWIDRFNSTDSNQGYNSTLGGRGVMPTEEVKAKISASVIKANAIRFSDKQQLQQQKEIFAKASQSSNRIKNLRITRASKKSRDKTSNDNIKRYLDPKARDKMAIACGGQRFEVFDKDGLYIGNWVNQAQCARDLGFPTAKYINYCLRDKIESYKGYIFQYL